MVAGQIGARQIKQAALILIDHAPCFGRDMPLLAIGQKRRAQFRGAVFDHLKRGALLRADHTGHKTLDDASLLARDFGQRFAQILLMIDRHRGDHRQRGIDDIGRVQPPA